MTLPGFYYGVFLASDGILALLSASFVYFKNKNSAVNKLVAINLLSFAFFTFFEGIIHILPLDMFEYFNLFRDIAAIGGVIASLLATIIGLYLWNGSQFIKRFEVKVPLAILSAIGIAGILDERVEYISSTDVIQITKGWFGYLAINVIPIMLMIVAFFGFYETIRTFNKDDAAYQKARQLPLALIAVILGITFLSASAALNYAFSPLSALGIISFALASLLFVYSFAK